MRERGRDRERAYIIATIDVIAHTSYYSMGIDNTIIIINNIIL